MINLEVVRSEFGPDSTLGKMFDVTGGERRLLCYTLEDERRDMKVPGETCIPKGTYQLKFRKEGGFHERYSKRFGDMHKGMIELYDVPGFKWILIHLGNTDDDTDGCLLVGSDAVKSGEDYKVTGSEVAYRKLYPFIADALSRGERVVLHITEAE